MSSMKVTYALSTLLICSFILGGCDLYIAKNGYTITLRVDQLTFKNLSQLQSSITNQSYKLHWNERKAVAPRIPGELVVLYSKEISEDKTEWVTIGIFYVKDIKNGIVRNLEFRISNIHDGWTNLTVRNEIDATGDFIYKKLVKLVGEDKVTIWRSRMAEQHSLKTFHRNMKSVDQTIGFKNRKGVKSGDD